MSTTTQDPPTSTRSIDERLAELERERDVIAGIGKRLPGEGRVTWKQYAEKDRRVMAARFAEGAALDKATEEVARRHTRRSRALADDRAKLDSEQQRADREHAAALERIRARRGVLEDRRRELEAIERGEIDERVRSTDLAPLVFEQLTRFHADDEAYKQNQRDEQEADRKRVAGWWRRGALTPWA